MKQTIRTFGAVEINDTNRTCAGELIGLLQAAGADVKWVEPKNMHLTLQFLGDVPATEIVEVCRAVERAAGEVEPFELERAVADLPVSQQAVIRLRFYLGLSFREIGTALSISANTAASRSRYAIRALRQRLLDRK